MLTLPRMANQKESQGLRPTKKGGQKLLQIREPLARKRDERVLAPPPEGDVPGSHGFSAARMKPVASADRWVVPVKMRESASVEFRPDFGKRLHRRGWAAL